MPLVNTSRKTLSSVVAAGSGNQHKGVQDSYATVGVISATNAVIAPMGIPVVYVDAVGAVPGPAAPAQWNVYTNQSWASSDSDLPNGAKIGVIVGKRWAGDNEEDVTLNSTTATNLVVVYRDSVVDMAGITFTGNAATKTAFRLQLEKQGVVVIDSATSALPKYEA